MRKEKWTTNNIPDLTGKVIIVTGGNSGLGYESVKAFTEKGAEVILAARDIVKGEKAKKEIGEVKGNIVVMQLDLASLDSIKNFTDTFNGKFKKLDILMNNAGIMLSPYFLTKDGFEGQMGINHLGHFALTGYLLKTLLNTPGSRVVNVSSNAHKWGKIDFKNFLFDDGMDYSPIKSYSRSKLANLLYTYELQKWFKKNNINSMAVAAHPGSSSTNLARYVENKWLFKTFKPLLMLMTQDQAQGALPQIRAAVDPNAQGGTYYGPNGFGEFKGSPVVVTSNGTSHSEEDAKKLWEISENLTGLTYSVS
jgi:NAD(P)-dependent dehydrogenase (short-subunit alcohol dehydrogenase family)